MSDAAAFAALDVAALPLVTVVDEEDSDVGSKFVVNPDAVHYLQSITSNVGSRPACLL